MRAISNEMDSAGTAITAANMPDGPVYILQVVNLGSGPVEVSDAEGVVAVVAANTTVIKGNQVLKGPITVDEYEGHGSFSDVTVILEREYPIFTYS